MIDLGEAFAQYPDIDRNRPIDLPVITKIAAERLVTFRSTGAEH